MVKNSREEFCIHVHVYTVFLSVTSTVSLDHNFYKNHDYEIFSNGVLHQKMKLNL